MVVDPDMYDWFRHREPIGRPGNAMFVYQVEPRLNLAWLAQCTQPVPPLSTVAAKEGFGRIELRITTFDCTSGWLYPGGGESPGWYALFRDTAHSDDAFIQARLAEASLSYEQRQARALPPFAIYEQTSPPTPSHSTHETSIQIGHLAFLGHTSSTLPVRLGQTIEVETWWRVDSLPERPLSIMMHLTGPEGAPVIVSDGLGVPVENWQMGDVIVQRHSLLIPADAPVGEYTPTMGVYWYDPADFTTERWPVERDGESIGNQLALPLITVIAE
jgi:hypothetical protein